MATDFQRAILLIRGKRVMLDADLAVVYTIATKVLVQAVHRNIERFPDDFMFRLTRAEAANLRSPGVTSSSGRGWGGRRYLPYAFTEQAFVRLRVLFISHEDLAEKVADLEKKYDANFKIVFDAIRALMAEPASRQREIGFRSSPESTPRNTRHRR